MLGHRRHSALFTQTIIIIAVVFKFSIFGIALNRESTFQVTSQSNILTKPLSLYSAQKAASSTVLFCSLQGKSFHGNNEELYSGKADTWERKIELKNNIQALNYLYFLCLTLF